MAIIKPKNEPWLQTAQEVAARSGFAAQSELDLRNAMEVFLRSRHPDARVVHEIVMGEGRTRADIAAIAEHTIEAVEVKGAFDDTNRLMHQVGMFQLCVPVVWIVCAENHWDDAKLIRYLLPSVGLIVGTGMDRGYHRKGLADLTLRVEALPEPREPHPEMLTRLLWRDEMAAICEHAGLDVGKRATRAKMTDALLSELEGEALIQQVCRELRCRNALWRADDPQEPKQVAMRRTT